MKIGSIARINFSIVVLCLAAILFSGAVGLLPDERIYIAASRTKVCESIAASVSYAIGNHDLGQAGRLMELFAGQNEDLLSIGLRRADNFLVVEVGEHASTWENAVQAKSDGVYFVPIANSRSKWGDLEIQFKPLYAGVHQLLSGSMIRLLCVVGFLVGAACWLHLRHILRYLDPNRSVPPRVREVLNSFAEGVVVLDVDDRIVLVNDTFAKHVDKKREQLIGTGLWDLSWHTDKVDDAPLPDFSAGSVRGVQMQLQDADGNITTIFSVNSSPVLNDKGEKKGVMMAFADVTPLEQNRAALLSTLQDLNQSKLEIAEQNEELRYLATRDPLTSCINRRTFFEEFESHWGNAKSNGIPLCGLMVDIDFFKPINDDYGHSMGDEVLRQTGALLNRLAREDDVVCRYGGEEFAILMPGLELDEAESAAEAIRIGMSEMVFPEFTITASLGISSYSLGADSPQDMLDEADKCLYVAKRNGRNRVIRYDTVPEDLVVDESKISRTQSSPESGTAADATIPFAAVSALLSALSFRDNQTGLHSARVSAYAALLAQEMMSPREVLVVEMAASLHDIGKVGVPDAILLKPSELTPAEWKFMKKHQRIGAEIVNRSFKHPGLTEIVKYHHYQFSGPASDEQTLWGEDIPLGARILNIADSFDAMVSDRPYRKGMPVADALAELRRCAGTQFDPELVGQFAQIVESGRATAVLSETQCYSKHVVLSIGEQVEQLVEAADKGDGETFVALAERLRSTALQHQIDPITAAANHAIAVASEDAQLDRLVEESLELLTACRLMRVNLTEPSQASDGLPLASH